MKCFFVRRDLRCAGRIIGAFLKPWSGYFHTIAVCAFTLTSSVTVKAGAFLQPPGSGQIIVTGRFEQSNTYSNASGRRQAVRDYRKFELQAWTEYGFNDVLTLIFAPSLARISTSARPTSVRRESQVRVAHGHLELGARLQLARKLQNVVSVQATIRLAQQFKKAPAGVLSREPHEIDVRLLYGKNFNIGRNSAFLDIQTGYRLRSGIADEWRTDLTLGILLRRKWTLLLQNFNVVSLGGNRDRRKRQHKAQMSFVYAISRTWSVQAGVFMTLAARNARRDRGMIAAVWRRF